MTTTLTDTTQPIELPTTTESNPVEPRLSRIRGTGWPALRRWTITAWRYLRTFCTVVRVGLLWARFCGATGIADQRTRVDLDTGKTTVRIRQVPRLGRVQIGAHGATLRVKLRPGQDLDTYTQVCPALRHTARCQAASAAEIDDKPGYLELRLLRRDPLHRVLERPHEIRDGVLAIGMIEDGQPWLLDLTAEPHAVVSGATGSGKSAIEAAILAALTPTPAVLIIWDLKFGLEAEPWRDRVTDIATTADQVNLWCTRLLELAAQRADGFRRLGVGNHEEATTAGVHLRRVVVVCDEVAEIALAGDDTAVSELLRVVQLVRAMGIHVIAAGQRFGSDLGKKITSVRAQIGGRVCARVNDVETARMVLSSLDEEAQRRALMIPRPGQAIVQTGATWHYARATYLTSAERRALAARHTDQAITWDALLAEDAALLPPAPVTAEATRLDTRKE